MTETVTGARCLALGAIDSGVAIVVGYPGSPATAVVNSILDLSPPGQTIVEWISNEKVAIEIAFGASLGGQRALLCVKGVGLNIALDPLMTMNLSGCNAGFVILVGDDPGGWGSQNEQDSRALATLIEIPWLEPTTASDARAAMKWAFELSEEIGVPVVLRITRALAEGSCTARSQEAAVDIPFTVVRAFQREWMRWVVLPINVVPYRRRLLQRLSRVASEFEASPLNGLEGDGKHGVIVAGFTYQKLLDMLNDSFPPQLRVFHLGTHFPTPRERLTAFLRTVDSVLVLEETAPLVEREVRAVAKSAGLTLPVMGRDTGHIPRVGELFAPDLAQALNRYVPTLSLTIGGEIGRSRPSREPLCSGCPYVPTFHALTEAITQRGGRDSFIVVGDPGCMVRAQMPPFELLDVKHSLGSAIGMAAGLTLSRRHAVDGPIQNRRDRQIVALCGDSGFLHSGLNGLIDAARLGVRLTVLILDNGTTALSGGQPHPASHVDARGEPRRAVDLAALARAAGAGTVSVVELDRDEDIHTPIAAGLDYNGLAVVIARGQCVRET